MVLDEPGGGGDVSAAGVASSGGATGAAKQRSVARVLSALQQSYQAASEAITFAALASASEVAEEWRAVREEVFLFNRIQNYLRTEPEPSAAQPRATVCGGVSWSTREDAIARREQARSAIISAVFRPEIITQLESVMDVWRSARSMAESYFKQCALKRQDAYSEDGAKQTLDTLLSMQAQLESQLKASKGPWREKEHEWVRRALAGESELMNEIKEVGLTASSALAGEHAKAILPVLLDACDKYFASWQRKLETSSALLRERSFAEAELLLISDASEVPDAQDPVRAEIDERIDSYTRQLTFIEQQRAEIDNTLAELTDISSLHLPETLCIVKALPSTCMFSTDVTSTTPRWVFYERERSLQSYQHVQNEPTSLIDHTKMESSCEAEEGVRYTLKRATYVDALSGTVTYCWLKVYAFHDKEEADARTTDPVSTCSSRSAVLQRIIEEEVRISDACQSSTVLSPTEFFMDAGRGEVAFHLPRGSTQQRFRSVHDVRRRIEYLGIRWLHDAIQCVLDLHACRNAHGSLTLGNFTYDDFGNTTLGCFASVLGGPQQNAETLSVAKDVLDFGVMLLSQVLPHLTDTSSRAPVSSPAHNLIPTFADIAREDTIRVFREVGGRLVGKEEPRWTLRQARTFVRKCLQYNFESHERSFLFSKEICAPPSWANRHRVAMPQVVVPHVATSRSAQAAGYPRARAFLNMNRPLWEVYWQCRRLMALDHQRDFCAPPSLREGLEEIFPCSDDCDVNERFLWFPCSSEDEAWRIGQGGFCKSKASSIVMRLRISHPTTQWGVICRAALGTVVVASSSSSSAQPAVVGDYNNNNDGNTQDKLLHAARERSLLCEDETGCLLVPSPWARCYPEYIVCLEG